MSQNTDLNASNDQAKVVIQKPCLLDTQNDEANQTLFDIQETQPQIEIPSTKEELLNSLLSRKVEFMGQTMQEKDFIELIHEAKYLSEDPKVALIAKITRYLEEGEEESLNTEERSLIKEI